MNLHVLPVRTAGAAENMAIDFLLLQRYPDAAAPRFRHYEWRGAAFTFGFSQKIAFVREKLAADLPTDLCRRPTGGGIVDHRNDWTYALVIPRGHALEEARATQSYRVVHEALTETLVALGQPAELKASCEPPEGERVDPNAFGGGASCGQAAPPTGVCFQRAELFDVVNSTTGAKIAGAAQKRNKHGLLFQGSIEKSSVGALDWDEFGARFAAALARVLGGEAVETPWPELHEEEVSGLVERYSSTEWIEYR
jgi:lipoate-protein ligase A